VDADVGSTHPHVHKKKKKKKKTKKKLEKSTNEKNEMYTDTELLSRVQHALTSLLVSASKAR
jgi:hypothetical protein